MLVPTTVSVNTIAYVPLILTVVGIEMDDREGLLVLRGFRFDIALDVNSAVKVSRQSERCRERMGAFPSCLSGASVGPHHPPIIV
jgi:hypothetical protein